MILDDLSLNDIVPSSIKNDAEVQNCIVALDAEFGLIKNAINDVNIYSAIDTLPMDIVQLLAWQFNVSSENKGWTVAATEDEKRKLVKDSIRLHKTKGTRYAIENVLNIVGLTGEISEWFDYQGNPYHFKVKIIFDEDVTEEKILRLTALIKEYKNARSYLELLLLDSKIQESKPYFAIGKVEKIISSIQPRITESLEMKNDAKIGFDFMEKIVSLIQPRITESLEMKNDAKVGVGFMETIKTIIYPSQSINIQINQNYG